VRGVGLIGAATEERHIPTGQRESGIPLRTEGAEAHPGSGPFPPLNEANHPLLAYSVAAVSSYAGRTGGMIGSSGYPMTASTMR
jgi:hypothetical protein